MKPDIENVTLSVVIPVLNEANYIAKLLTALNEQTRQPDEIIVADAGSTDGTVEIAKQHGAKVVDGGLPAAGRNLGAKAATSNLILFLDADVLPTPHFIETLVSEFYRKNLDAATCFMEAISENAIDQLLHQATNAYLMATQKVRPHAPGFAILIWRDLHQTIGGFDEALALAEDHDYVERASKHGRFRVLRHVSIPVSVRRLNKEGLMALAVKYLWSEAHVLTGNPMYSTPFDYQFGEHDDSTKPLSFIEEISEQILATIRSSLNSDESSAEDNDTK